MIDYLKRLFKLYKYPVTILSITFMVYNLFGVKTSGGSRSPMPPMSSVENALFTISYIIIIFCTLWIIIIAMTDK